MKTVYRVEHRLSHKGPYRKTGTGVYPELAETMDIELRHREPFRDGPTLSLAIDLYEPKDLRFGFRDLEQFGRWFDERERRILQEHQYVLGIYEVSFYHVWEGEHQLAFEAGHETRVGEMEIADAESRLAERGSPPRYTGPAGGTNGLSRAPQSRPEEDRVRPVVWGERGAGSPIVPADPAPADL